MKEKNALQKWISDNVVCFYSFLLPFAAMMLIFISNEIYPFGDESFMHSDMYHQYVPFLREFVRKIRDGESLGYSWNIGLGSNYLALFIYYCASPFNWLALLFPTEYLIEFMSYMVVLKIGLAGFAFAYYLRHRFHSDSLMIVFFSLFYAMSGFVAAYNWNVMWMDCLFLAPLVILGLEKLVKEGKCTLYCLTLALCILSNYYLSIMLCIFLCLYFLVLLPDLTGHKSIIDFLKKATWAIGRFALYSLLAGGMAGVLLLPELAALHASEFTQFHFPDTVKFYFSLFDMIARHVTGVKIETGLDHWPNIFCSSAFFVLFPLYVFNRSIPARQKAGRLALCAFMLLSFASNQLNYIWHGFNYPNSLPARQSFLYVFLVLTLCYETLHRLEGFTRSQLLHSFTLGLGFLILAEKLVTDDAFTTSVFLLSMGFLCIYTMLVYAYRICNTSAMKCVCAVLALTVVTFEATYHMASTSVSTTSRSKYLNLLPTYESLAKTAQETDPGFYRFEKFSRTTKNDGALADYPTASCFASTANARAGNWYDRMGLSESKVFYCSDGLTPFSSALLNVHYMYSRSADEDPSLYTLFKEENGVYLYRCNYTLPAGYVLPEGVEISSANMVQSAEDPLDLQNKMSAQLVSDRLMFHPVSVSNEEEEASFVTETAGHYYAYSQNSKVDTVKLESASLEKTFKKVKYDYILDLGFHESGETVVLTNSSDGALNLAAYRLDIDTLAHALDILGSTAFAVDGYDAESLNGHITLDTAGTLILSIPYESGWTLTVNGEPAEFSSYDELFISVDLPAGEHSICLTFYPDGLNAGICLSLLSAVLFILILKKTKRIDKATFTY